MADKEISELTAADTLDGDELVHVDQGGNSRKATLTSIVALSTGAMLKSVYDPNDDQIIAVAQGGTNAATASGARTNLGLGTIAVQNAATVAITGGTVTGITDLAVADGGTGGSDASTARTNLGLVIGTDVQAYSANLAGFAATTTANVQNRVNHTGTQLAATISDFSTASDLRIAAAVDVTVQAYSATLDDWSAIATADKLDASVIPAAEDGKILSWTGTSLVNKTAGDLGTFVVGEDVQAYSANLDDWSAIATSTKQAASANLTTLAGVTPGSKGLAILADTTSDAVLTELGGGTSGKAVFAAANTAALTTALAGAVDDTTLAAPSLLRNRNLDQVLLTDFFTTASAQNDFRNGDNPDITQVVQDMDDALAEGGVAYIPKKAGTLSGTVSKQFSTHWIARGSTIFGTWNCAYNGNIIEIVNSGTHASRDGGISGLRLLGNNTTYPLARAIYAINTFTHRFEDMRILGFDYGIYGENNVAMQGKNLYISDCLTDGQYESAPSDADPLTWSSDHRFEDCQWTGNRYGFHADSSGPGTIKMIGCRPQASGVANLRLNECEDFQMIGGFCDSANLQNPDSLGGDGATLINCSGAIFNGVAFFYNGISTDANKAHIRFTASSGVSKGNIINACTFRDHSSNPMIGIAIGAPTGGASYDGLIISNNDLSQVDDPITGVTNVATGLHIDNNNTFGAGTSFVPYLGVNGATTDQNPSPHYETVRYTGTLNTSFDIYLPSAGCFVGKRMRITRVSGGTANIRVRSPSGPTTLVTWSAAAGSADFVCTTASATAANVVWAVA